jgi:hypothetical protein
MKKIFLSVLVSLFMLMSLAAPVSAKTTVIKGTLTALNGDGTVTLNSSKGETLVIALPAGFDASTLVVGDTLLIKGTTAADGSFQAETVTVVTADDEDADDAEDDDSSDEDGSKADSAYCSGAKESAHPLAVRIAARYGVSEAWVMEKFCSGFGMGAIMLSLKTQQLSGANPDDLLAQRLEGMGWGNIWKEQGLIGSEKSIQAPKGKLRHQELEKEQQLEENQGQGNGKGQEKDKGGKKK